jgi:poly(3-hydroxybutyrate) depolymerase
VVDLHGGGGCASDSAAWSGWQKLSEGNDEDDTFIVIWPQGSGGGNWGVGGSEWSVINAETSSTGKDTFDAPDLEFLAEIVASTDAPVDLERIYFTGFSMGCMMSLRFLLERSDLIAGAHCHGGYLVSPESGTSIIPSSLPIGVYMTGGDADDWFAMSEDQFDVWTNFNNDGCVESTTSVTLSGSELTDATLKTCGNVDRMVVSVLGGGGEETSC